MGLTGKYDFKGIKKFGARGLLLAAATIPAVGAVFVKVPLLRSMSEGIFELLSNWLANNGLIIFNVEAIAVEGEWDQHVFDSALDSAFKKIEDHTGELTPAQIKAIDDEVIQAARQFIAINKPR